LLSASPAPDSKPGRLDQTTFIQRVNTTGGLAPPASECTAATAGTQAEVPYTAEPYFWKWAALDFDEKRGPSIACGAGPPHRRAPFADGEIHCVECLVTAALMKMPARPLLTTAALVNEIVTMHNQQLQLGETLECARTSRRGHEAFRHELPATGRCGGRSYAWSLAQVSLRPSVRLKTGRPGVESGSGQK
jgi:Protein of unknown function (DUF3455)